MTSRWPTRSGLRSRPYASPCWPWANGQPTCCWHNCETTTAESRARTCRPRSSSASRRDPFRSNARRRLDEQRFQLLQRTPFRLRHQSQDDQEPHDREQAIDQEGSGTADVRDLPREQELHEKADGGIDQPDERDRETAYP